MMRPLHADTTGHCSWSADGTRIATSCYNGEVAVLAAEAAEARSLED